MKRIDAGFTLLELIVVLVILGMTAALATPALVRLVDSLGERDQRDRVLIMLRELPVAVMREGRAKHLVPTQGYVPAPTVFDHQDEAIRNARVWIPHKIEYLANGACTGGVLHWQLQGQTRMTVELAAPLCLPDTNS